MKLVILGLLQNQWARNPKAVADMFARHPEHRNQLIGRMLMQSVSGRHLQGAFGDWTERITWENASPGIVGHSGGSLPPDVEHINRTLTSLSPALVITFGRQAEWGVAHSSWTGPTIAPPHPAARCGDMHERLRDAYRELEMFVEVSR